MTGVRTELLVAFPRIPWESCLAISAPGRSRTPESGGARKQAPRADDTIERHGGGWPYGALTTPSCAPRLQLSGRMTTMAPRCEGHMGHRPIRRASAFLPSPAAGRPRPERSAFGETDSGPVSR